MLGFFGRGRAIGGALCSIGGAFLALSPFSGGEDGAARSVSGPSLVVSHVEARARELESEAEALSVRFAPTFLQETSGAHPERDRPLALDFDGDFRAENNWEHLSRASLAQKPTVYGSAILTSSHAYLTYTLFYPRDWARPFCVSYVCHDNDLETVLVIADRRDGSLVFVESKSHRSYLAVRGEEVRRDAFGRPIIAVESEGHGMRILKNNASESDDTPGTRVFFHESRAARGSHDSSEPYVLASLFDSLWSRRAIRAREAGLWTEGETGPLYYAGERAGRLGLALGASMAGEVYAGGVRPPWALKAEVGARGDWFLDPAFVARSQHGAWFGGNEANLRYELNPYLADLRGECAGPSCAQPPGKSSAFPFTRSALGTLILALGAVAWLPRFGRLARRRRGNDEKQR